MKDHMSINVHNCEEIRNSLLQNQHLKKKFRWMQDSLIECMMFGVVRVFFFVKTLAEIFKITADH